MARFGSQMIFLPHQILPAGFPAQLGCYWSSAHGRFSSSKILTTSDETSSFLVIAVKQKLLCFFCISTAGLELKGKTMGPKYFQS